MDKEPINTNDFIDGQKDCVEGKPADPSRSSSYQRGYGAQYELEQARSALCPQT